MMLVVLVYLSIVAACVAVGMAYSRFTPGDCCGCSIATAFCNKCLDDEAAYTYEVVISGGTDVDGTYYVTPTTSPQPGTYCLWITPEIGYDCGAVTLRFIEFRIYVSLFGSSSKLVDVRFVFNTPASCTVEGGIPTTEGGLSADCLGELDGKVLNVGNTCGTGCGLNNAVATITAV